jgi:small conductance mechanosensitive channel
METDAGITLERIERFIQGFWWILPNLAIAGVVFLLFLLSAAAARAGVLRVFKRRRRPDLAVLLAGFTRWAIVSLGLLVVATIVFPSVRPADILATLGIGSIAVGFAFKDILQNWLAGLLLLLRQPFHQGDQIVVSNHEGTVERIEARATLIRTFDGRRVIIPNSQVYTESVVVNTAFGLRRSEYDVGVGYGDDLEEACGIIVDALSRVPGVAADPPPEAIPWELAASSVNIKVRWWTDPRQGPKLETRGRVITTVKRALNRAGIDLPFPTEVVLFHDQTEETDGDRKRQREGWPAGATPPAPRHLNRIMIEREGERPDRPGSTGQKENPPGSSSGGLG